MFLTSTASPLPAYLQLAALKADTSLDLGDRSGNQLSDATLSQLLVDCSGDIDAQIGTSYLPQQETLRIYGDGSTHLRLNRYPLIYVRQVKLVLPNTVGFDVPVASLLVDQWGGYLTNVSPLVFQSLGFTTSFPKGIAVDVTCAWGINWPVPPPVFTATPVIGTSYTIAGGSPTPLSVGTHQVQVTSVSMNGEGLPSPAQAVMIAPGQGAINVSVVSSPGALKYYVYDNGNFVSELQAYAIGQGTVAVAFNGSPSTSPIAVNFDGTPRQVPTVDNSAAPYYGKYAALPRLCKLLTQSQIWESRNLSNQGIASQASGPKRIQFKDNLHSTYAKRIDDLIDSLAYQGIA